MDLHRGIDVTGNTDVIRKYMDETGKEVVRPYIGQSKTEELQCNNTKLYVVDK